jgi:hypothetical protein
MRSNDKRLKESQRRRRARTPMGERAAIKWLLGVALQRP